MTKLIVPTDLSSRMRKTLSVGKKYHSGKASMGVSKGLDNESPGQGSTVAKPSDAQAMLTMPCQSDLE